MKRFRSRKPTAILRKPSRKTNLSLWDIIAYSVFDMVGDAPDNPLSVITCIIVVASAFVTPSLLDSPTNRSESRKYIAGFLPCLILILAVVYGMVLQLAGGGGGMVLLVP